MERKSGAAFGKTGGGTGFVCNYINYNTSSQRKQTMPMIPEQNGSGKINNDLLKPMPTALT